MLYYTHIVPHRSTPLGSQRSLFLCHADQSASLCTGNSDSSKAMITESILTNGNNGRPGVGGNGMAVGSEGAGQWF